LPYAIFAFIAADAAAITGHACHAIRFFMIFAIELRFTIFADAAISPAAAAFRLRRFHHAAADTPHAATLFADTPPPLFRFTTPLMPAA
jgi:hypothetical protein